MTKTAAEAPGASESIGVLFIHTATSGSLGADVWVHASIMRDLDQTTHSVHVACVPGAAGAPTPTYAAVSSIPGVSVVRVHGGPRRPRDRSFGSVLRLLSEAVRGVVDLLRLFVYIHRHRINIVHTSDRPRDAVAAVLLGRCTRARSVVHAHVLYGEWMSRPLRWAVHRADARVAVSEFVRHGLLRAGSADDRTHVVLNAIDPASWRPGTGRSERRAEFAISESAPVVLTVSRLFPEKGTKSLIEAVARLRDEFPDIRLIVVGQDPAPGQPFARELITRVEQLGLEDNVVFTGRRSDIAELMAAADVFAMPSFEEPFGLVFLEAMATELPVVALDNGGTVEVVGHDVEGLLSPPGDIDVLVRHIDQLLRDPERRRRMGRAGRARVFREFTTARMASDVATVYRLILSSPR